MKIPRPLDYAVEVSHADQSLDECRRRALEYLKRGDEEYEMAIERPAKIVVRFSSELAARRFYYRLGGRFVGIPSQPFQVKPSQE